MGKRCKKLDFFKPDEKIRFLPDILDDFFDVFDTLWAREKATTRLFLQNRMFVFQNYLCKVSIRAGRDLGNKIQKYS